MTLTQWGIPKQYPGPKAASWTIIDTLLYYFFNMTRLCESITFLLDRMEVKLCEVLTAMWDKLLEIIENTAQHLGSGMHCLK